MTLVSLAEARAHRRGFWRDFGHDLDTVIARLVAVGSRMRRARAARVAIILDGAGVELVLEDAP